MDLQKRFDSLSMKFDAMKKERKENALARKAKIKALSAHVETLSKGIEKGLTDLKAVSNNIRVASLTAQFRAFVKGGKMTLVEFKALDVSALSDMPAKALSAILASYEARPVSSDFVQHGEAGAKPISLAGASPAAVRELMKAQKAGKTGPVALASDEDMTDEEKAAKKKKESEAAAGDGGKDGKGDDEKASDLKATDVEGAIKAIGEMQSQLESHSSEIKAMGEKLKAMLEEKDDKTDDNKEGEEE